MQEKKLTGICKEVAKNLEGKNLDGYEVYASNSVENDIEVFKGRVDSLSFSDSSGIGIRIFRDNAIGYAYTSMLEGGSISDCAERAIENSRITTKEKINALPGKEEYLYPEKTTGTDSLFSKNYFKLTLEEKIKATKDLEKITKGKDKRIKGIQHVMYHDNALEVALINSKGFSDSYRASGCFMYISAISKQNDDTSTGDYFGFGRDLGQIDLDDIASNAAKRSTMLLGGKKVRSQKMDLILDPLVAAQLMGVIADALTADSVQKGKSIFKGKIGKKIFSIDIDIYDNGVLEGGLSSAPFDGEGVYRGKTAVVKNGILKTFLYNTYTARKDKTKSTGNAQRASYRSTPSVGISNFYVEPGNRSARDIISGTSKGFMVSDIIGLHSGANPISGDISVGAKGLLVENGSIAAPVKEVTIATNFLGLCKSIKMVADDLRFIPSSGYIGSPTMLVEGIMVAGT